MCTPGTDAQVGSRSPRKFRGLTQCGVRTEALACAIKELAVGTEVAINARDQVMFDRITFDSSIMGGRACIRGMRIPVSAIVGQIAHGATWEELLEGYPDLERDDIQQAIEYAAWLTHEEVRVG